MNLLVKDAFDAETSRAQIDFPTLAKDLGYMSLGNVRTAAMLAGALKQYGPVFVMGAGSVKDLIVSGVSGNTVKVFDIATQQFTSQLFPVFLHENVNRLYVAPLFGNNPPGEFSELQAVRDGCGDYHANHFISYFRSSTVTPQWISQLFRNFDDVFNMENIATVEKTDYFYKQKPVLEFAINGLSGKFHQDFVVFSKGKKKNFYGSTLKRNWRYPLEDVLNLFDPFNFVTLDDEGYAVNSRHFLAGRRSWNFGLVHDDLYYIETVAIERYSHPAYELAASLGLIERQMLVDIWTNLLNNTMAASQLTTVAAPTPMPNYNMVTLSRGDTYYREFSSNSLAVIKSDAGLADVYARNPDIVPPV